MWEGFFTRAGGQSRFARKGADTTMATRPSVHRDHRTGRAAPRAPGLARIACALALLAWAGTSRAGPPFVTDDPEPVDYGHWEINSAVTGTRSVGTTNAFAPQVDTNYGAAPGVQLHVQPQVAYTSMGGSASTQHAYGLGDTELGIKLRLLDQAAGDGQWMLSFYPFYEVPTGNAARGLGAGAHSEYLPLWLQWAGGGWTTFGGGGYWINPGAGRRNAWAGGWAALYQFTADLQLGGEVYARTADSADSRTSAAFNIGGTYSLGKDTALLFSLGRGLVNTPGNQASGYFGLRVTH